MRRVIAALAAGSVLTGSAFIAGAVGGTGSATAHESADDDSTTTETPHHRFGARILDDVLSDLVDDEVITQDQAGAIQEALADRLAELREKVGDRRGFGHGFRRGFRLGWLLDDGVIDADELAKLPEDHPLKAADGPAAEYLDDGELTLQELREIHGQLREQGAETTFAA